jgi:hypothetical protein
LLADLIHFTGEGAAPQAPGEWTPSNGNELPTMMMAMTM